MNYDSNITKTPKPSTPSYTINAKPAESSSITAKPSAPSYTVNAKPTASYTITAKATSPTVTKVPKPYLEPLGLLTEDSVQLLHESGINIVTEGTP